MSLQILTWKLHDITAGDYLTWRRDPEPLALDLTLRSISIDADPLGDTITASLDWNGSAPPASAAAPAAGLQLSAGVEIDPLHAGRVRREGRRHLTRIPTAGARTASPDPEQRLPRSARDEQELRTAA